MSFEKCRYTDCFLLMSLYFSVTKNANDMEILVFRLLSLYKCIQAQSTTELFFEQERIYQSKILSENPFLLINFSCSSHYSNEFIEYFSGFHRIYIKFHEKKTNPRTGKNIELTYL